MFGWRRYALVPGLALATLLGACTQGPTLTGQRASTDAGAPAPIERDLALLTDIPVPAGAQLDLEKSIILGELDRWTGRVRLNTGLSASQAFALYQREMPAFGWEPVMSVQAEISALAFVRGERAATVQIQARTINGSVVAVTVAPRQSTETRALAVQ